MGTKLLLFFMWGIFEKKTTASGKLIVVKEIVQTGKNFGRLKNHAA